MEDVEDYNKVNVTKYDDNGGESSQLTWTKNQTITEEGVYNLEGVSDGSPLEETSLHLEENYQITEDETASTITVSVEDEYIYAKDFQLTSQSGPFRIESIEENQNEDMVLIYDGDPQAGDLVHLEINVNGAAIEMMVFKQQDGSWRLRIQEASALN
ncbi:hypothetical protein [Salibacterium sp. K-3]